MQTRFTVMKGDIRCLPFASSSAVFPLIRPFNGVWLIPPSVWAVGSPTAQTSGILVTNPTPSIVTVSYGFVDLEGPNQLVPMLPQLGATVLGWNLVQPLDISALTIANSVNATVVATAFDPTTGTVTISLSVPIAMVTTWIMILNSYSVAGSEMPTFARYHFGTTSNKVNLTLSPIASSISLYEPETGDTGIIFSSSTIVYTVQLSLSFSTWQIAGSSTFYASGGTNYGMWSPVF